MAQTAVINRRRRRAKTSRRRKNPRRRRHYAGAAASPKRRRRSSKRRRRNPSTGAAIVKAAYQPQGYRRQNPTIAQDFNGIMEILPGATGGVLAARWAVKQAGDFEKNDKGIPEPGFKHALAIYLAARFGGQMIGSLLGDANKGKLAEIAAYGFGGDMFLRLKFMRDNETFTKNFSLAGVDDAYEDEQSEPYADMGAYEDAVGNKWIRTASGWQLEGFRDDANAAPQRLAGFQSQSALGGFQSHSALGGARASSGSSFGYSR